MNDVVKNEMAEQFTELVMRGIEMWEKAGQIVVDLIDVHGETCNSIADKTPMDSRIIGRFEQLGRKQIMPYLLMVTYPAARHILKLPYSEQKRLENETVDLLVEKHDGIDTLKVAVPDLQKDQCKQVFSGGSLRDLAAQRAWLIDQSRTNRLSAARQLVASDQEPYSFGKKNTVIFSRPCELSRKELLRILEDMESQ